MKFLELLFGIALKIAIVGIAVFEETTCQKWSKVVAKFKSQAMEVPLNASKRASLLPHRFTEITIHVANLEL